MKHKKIIIIAAIAAAALLTYKLVSPPKQNDTWNEQIHTVQRSSGGSGRRNYSSEQSGSETSSNMQYYAGSSGYSGQNTTQGNAIQDAAGNAANAMQNAAGNAVNAIQNAADSASNALNNAANSIDNMINNLTGGMSMGTQLKWWYLVEEYNLGPQRILDEYARTFLTVRDAVYDTGVSTSGGIRLPYVVFQRNGAKAYMYFTADHEDEVMKLTKAFPVTITGGEAAFSYNTLYLYNCQFGY